VYIDLHIGVDPHLPIQVAHDIGCAVERQILTTLEEVTDVVVHTEPAHTQLQVIPDEMLRQSLQSLPSKSTPHAPHNQAYDG
jgi:divalent metal cation (Fe/Co/Zn/Cd) transporter